jgi:VWFA-related protein
MPFRVLFACSMLVGIPSASGAPSQPPPVERIEVRLAQIDVIVRDAHGGIVSGLGAGAFKVLEDGSPMEVVAVDEWGAGKPAVGVTPAPQSTPASPESSTASSTKDARVPEEAERRSFIMVFDALGDPTALRMNQAKRSATAFFRAHLGTTDVAAVYQLDASLRALSGVTSNVGELEGAIEKVTWMSPSSLQDDMAESIVANNSSAAAPYMKQRLSNLAISAAQQLDWQREHVYDSLNRLASVFQELPGRRVLILASAGFPLTTAGDAKSGSGGFTPGFRDLIRSLATYGVTVYALDIGNDLAAGDVSQTIDWRVAVGKLGMDENVLSDLGLERAAGTSTASARREFLGVIASETGGRLLAQTDLSKAFNEIQEESTRFYRISYRVPVSGSISRYRKLLVTVDAPGCVVASRRGRYSDITPSNQSASGALASVESVDRYRPLATRGVALALPGSDPQKVPVVVVIEALGPIEFPLDALGGAALDLEFRVVARAEGEIVDRYAASLTARVKPDGVAAIRRAFRVEGRLLLVPGIYEIQGTVRIGAPAQLASWSSTVAVPPPPQASVPTIVGATISAENDPEAPLLSHPPIPVETDSLTLKPGVRVLPSTRAEFDLGGSLLVCFWLRGLPDTGQKPPALDVSVRLVDAEGKSLDLPTKLLFFGKEPSGGYRAAARVDASSLASGTYALQLSAGVEGHKESAARSSLSFTLRAKPPATSTSASAG